MITPCNDENFQKYVLWHLAGLRADMMQMQSILLGSAAQGNEPGAEAKAKWFEAHKKNWDLLYQDALTKCNLRPPQGADAPVWQTS